MADEDDEEKYITWTDRMRAQTYPIVDRNDSGQMIYPRQDFLNEQMRKRKEEAEAAARAEAQRMKEAQKKSR